MTLTQFSRASIDKQITLHNWHCINDLARRFYPGATRATGTPVITNDRPQFVSLPLHSIKFSGHVMGDDYNHSYPTAEQIRLLINQAELTRNAYAEFCIVVPGPHSDQILLEEFWPDYEYETTIGDPDVYVFSTDILEWDLTQTPASTHIHTAG